jgi:transposase
MTPTGTTRAAAEVAALVIRLRVQPPRRGVVALRQLLRGAPPAVSGPPAAPLPRTVADGDARAVNFPRRVRDLLQGALDLRDRHAAGQVSDHGLAVARGRLANELVKAVFPPKVDPANERLAKHLWAHRGQLLTFLAAPGLDATNWRAELAIRFGVILRKVWGGNRTWAGARAQAGLMSVWRTCWQHGRSALDFLSQLLCGVPPALDFLSQLLCGVPPALAFPP